MYKLMIVEDEEIIRRGLIAVVDWQALGFEIVAQAENGKEALSIIRKQQPDILLLDIQMPIMNGIELMQILAEKYPDIRVIILSGYNDFQYAQEAIRFSALSYVLKPTKKSEIEHVFQRARIALDKARAQSDEIHKLLEQSGRSIEAHRVAAVQDPVIDRIKHYIEEQYDQRITIESVAALVFMNPTYISTFFKAKTGVSFKDYLTSVRMDRAKQLLLETNLKIYDVSLKVGYDDFHYFSRLFKKFTGVNAFEYRKSIGSLPAGNPEAQAGSCT